MLFSLSGMNPLIISFFVALVLLIKFICYLLFSIVEIKDMNYLEFITARGVKCLMLILFRCFW